jgi:hypothetical protein
MKVKSLNFVFEKRKDTTRSSRRWYEVQVLRYLFKYFEFPIIFTPFKFLRFSYHLPSCPHLEIKDFGPPARGGHYFSLNFTLSSSSRGGHES